MKAKIVLYYIISSFSSGMNYMNYTSSYMNNIYYVTAHSKKNDW